MVKSDLAETQLKVSKTVSGPSQKIHKVKPRVVESFSPNVLDSTQTVKLSLSP